MAGDLMALTHRRSEAVITERSQLATIREQARAAILSLQAIRDDPTVTNAEAVTYIKDEALVLQRVIRFVVGQVT